MTMSMAQLEQLASLTSARDRVLELWKLMVPLVAELAKEGNSLAAYLIDEHDRAQEAMVLASMSAHHFLEEKTDG